MFKQEQRRNPTEASGEEDEIVSDPLDQLIQAVQAWDLFTEDCGPPKKKRKKWIPNQRLRMKKLTVTPSRILCFPPESPGNDESGSDISDLSLYLKEDFVLDSRVQLSLNRI